jgi:hypothetical protein
MESQTSEGGMKSETPLMRAIMSELSRWGARVFRNNVGGVATADGRWIDFGLCTGSSDIIGWQSVQVTPDMVGKRIAVFLACEVKTPGGRASGSQRRFLDAVQEAGGIALLLRDQNDVEKALENPLAFSGKKA